MADKEVRISKVLKEFSIGIDHVIEFLTKKGFTVDKNPNSKIPGEAYALLEQEFAKDKEIKKVADDIAREKLRKENTVIEAKSVAETPPPAETVKEEDVRESLTHMKLEFAEKELKKKKTKKEEKTAETEVIKAKAKIEEPKVVGKIELEEKPKTKKKEEESETVKEEKKTKKGKAKKEEAVAEETTEKKTARGKKKSEEEEATPVAEVTVQPSSPVEEPPAPAAPAAETPAEPKQEEAFRVSPKEILSGPTIVGKIQLPVEPPKKKPVATSAPDEAGRKKRKRTEKKVNIKEVGQKIDKTADYRKDRQDLRKPQPRKPEPAAEITDRDIQEQIKATLARLSGGKSKTGAKLKKAKRDAAKEEAAIASAGAAAE